MNPGETVLFGAVLVACDIGFSFAAYALIRSSSARWPHAKYLWSLMPVGTVLFTLGVAWPRPNSASQWERLPGELLIEAAILALGTWSVWIYLSMCAHHLFPSQQRTDLTLTTGDCLLTAAVVGLYVAVGTLVLDSRILHAPSSGHLEEGVSLGLLVAVPATVVAYALTKVLAARWVRIRAKPSSEAGH